MKTKTYTHFIVLSAPRSGSNHLIHFLSSHPEIKMYGEPFQPSFLLGNPKRTLFENPVIAWVYRYTRGLLPVFWVNHLIYKEYPPNTHAVGFKIFYEHAQGKNLQKIWPFLRSIPDLKVIHLKRKNILDAYASLIMAFKTGRFISHGSAVNNQPLKITLDYKKCEKYFIQIEKWRKQYTRYFSQKHVHTIYYEDLVRHPDKELTKIERFLGISQRRMYSALVKQRRWPLSHIVTNYAQLKKQFKQTRWTHFFNT